MTRARSDHWFAVKQYGWGWGMPVRWQGWLVLFGYLGLIYAGIYSLLPSRGGKAFLIYLLALTALLIVVLFWKGERPLRFRWGGK